MSEHERPTPDDIEALTEAIEELDAPWTVDDWIYTAGRYDPSELDVCLEWSPPAPEPLEIREIQDLKSLIHKIESRYEEGAPMDVIVEEASERFEWDRDQVDNELDNLRSKGEVYEPKQSHLRTT